jgi:hypothetical protein
MQLCRAPEIVPAYPLPPGSKGRPRNLAGVVTEPHCVHAMEDMIFFLHCPCVLPHCVILQPFFCVGHPGVMKVHKVNNNLHS